MGNNSGGCVGSGVGVGVGVHEAGMLARWAVGCVMVCRGLECSLGGLHRSWFFQKMSHKLVRRRFGTLVLGRCIWNSKGSPKSQERAVRLWRMVQQYNFQTPIFRCSVDTV